MLSTLRSFVESTIAHADTEQQKAVGMQIAATALLLEIAAADFDRQPEERGLIRQALQQAFSLEMQAVDALMHQAEEHHTQSISLHEYIRVLNEQCTQRQKFEILVQLWRVAFADGRLDKYEDNAIRRIADLLYLPHREFIQAKLAAQDPVWLG